MKFIAEEKDKKYTKAINTAFENNESVPVFLSEKNKKYYLEFTCTDLGKANAFIMNLMSPNYSDNIKEKLGIEVLNVTYSLDPKIDRAKAILENALREINEL